MTLYRLVLQIGTVFFSAWYGKKYLIPHTKGRPQPNTSVYYTITTSTLPRTKCTQGYSLTDSSTVGTLAVEGIQTQLWLISAVLPQALCHLYGVLPCNASTSGVLIVQHYTVNTEVHRPHWYLKLCGSMTHG